jgi:hypothetical protein
MTPPAMRPTPRVEKVRSADTAPTITAPRAPVLPQVCWLATITVLLGATPPEVVVEAPPSRREGEAEILSLRATELVATDLARLGAAVWPRPATAQPAVPGTAPLSVSVRLEGTRLALLARAGALTVTTTGTVDRLDAAASRVARALAPRLGLPAAGVPDAQLAAGDPTPPLVQRALGQAGLDLAIGQPHRARLRFGRAEELWRGTIVPAALEGTWAAILRAARSTGEAVATVDPLARSSWEGAELALRGRQPARALELYASALRYWPDRAQPWALPLEVTTELAADDARWWLVSEGHARALEPRTGAVLVELHAPGRWLGQVGDDTLRLEKSTLVRATPGGVVRWRRELPWASPHLDLVALASGFALAHAAEGLLWLDASTGAIAQAEPGAVVLASGLEGALVRLGGGDLALLRPGRRAPAWTAAGPAALSARMVPGRVLWLAGDHLHILDSTTGKVRGTPLAVPEGARWLTAEGRHAVLGAGRQVQLVDVLAGEERARLAGPAEATAAAAEESGVLVAFETGDVFWLDREGSLADRGRVIGRPSAARSAPPRAGGFVVRTDRGLIALGPVPSPERPRELDLALRLATLAKAQGDARGALRLAERVALLGAGRVSEAEQLRASLLEADGRAGSREAAHAARARAASARDPSVPLPPFLLR